MDHTAPSPSLATEFLMRQAAREDARDRRALRLATLAALLIHALLLAVHVPRTRAEAATPRQKEKVFVLQVPRFQPPVIDPVEIPPPPRQRVPIPDPTPDAPEVVRNLEMAPPRLDLPSPDVLFGLPSEPPPPPAATGPYTVDGEVTAPVPIHQPRPLYTELARRARIQGAVLLKAIIGADGQVGHLEVAKGLPMGLTDSALEAVRQWRYAPATLRGKPVPVYFNITVHFQLQ